MRVPRVLGVGIASLTLFAVFAAHPAMTSADEAAAPAAAPTVEQRLANLEAYVTNGAPDPRGGALAAAPGPGHNGWMMTSTALVLFMTLPGLALFHGGLVRRKNVLSVVAQCFGCAGLVTLLWWVVGYSLVFGKGNGIRGGLDLRCSGSAPAWSQGWS
jgi:ammonium transporter, Amt family